ncbi:CHAD domain-containing protein [Streptomyces sp. NPDC001744]|uniref:CYTH and CHAD domain-containing protein n=1 Tax=Streptomyces sp. NPDC001744 TaxID=3364606 RepID=UPI0036739F74
MAETKRETERKYEATPETDVPDLTGVPGVATVVDDGVTELDAVYHDTPDLRLAADSITLRRRTGGADEGWHLKFPVAAGVRDEIRAPLSPTGTDTLPPDLAVLLRSRVRRGEVVPVVRLRSARDVRRLLDADGAPLAELSVDTVHAERLPDGPRTSWTEIEVEAAEGADPRVLDAVGKRLGKAGIRPARHPSKLARALAETAPEDRGGHGGHGGHPAPGTAGAAVLAYVREQAGAIVALDPAVRRDLPDAVHRFRVACRRLRGALKTYRSVLDRKATDPLGDELKWLAGELGAARDQEVLTERLRALLADVPRPLRRGPVKARLRVWAAARADDARRRAVTALDSDRYLALLDALDALLTDPPLRRAASRDAAGVLARAVRKDHDRLAARVDRALSLAPGRERDLALHEARKAAKRARYAADAARPTLGKPAKKFSGRVKAVQSLLGEHQDSVVARKALLEIAAQAHAAGETAFTWGLLHGREEAAAGATERDLPRVRSRATVPRSLRH